MKDDTRFLLRVKLKTSDSYAFAGSFTSHTAAGEAAKKAGFYSGKWHTSIIPYTENEIVSIQNFKDCATLDTIEIQDAVRNAICEFLNELQQQNFINPAKFYNTLCSVKQAAQMHNVSEQTVINYINDGLIPVEPRSVNESYKIRLSDALQLDFNKLQKQLKKQLKK